MKKWSEEGEIDKAAEMEVHCYVCLSVGAHYTHHIHCLAVLAHRACLHPLTPQAMIAWSADMTKWFYFVYKIWGKQGIKATPMPAGLKKGTTAFNKEKGRRANDPTKRAAKKARTEAKTLLVPSDYTGIRAGSVYFSVEASVGDKKKLIAAHCTNVHLAALLYNAFVGATCHSAGYNRVENHVGETELKELQRKALRVVKSKRTIWDGKWSKCRADQDEDMHDVYDEDDQGMDEDEDGAPMEFSRRSRR
jgi:hypothetical protein